MKNKPTQSKPGANPVEPWKEPEETYITQIAPGGVGGDPVAIDCKDGRIVRIRPIHYESAYSKEEIAATNFKYEKDGKVLSPLPKSLPSIFAFAYKKRVYSPNRVGYPLKRVDWEPGGDPAKINAQNRGKSKFKRISWDEAADIVASEIKRVQGTYGKYAVMAIGDDGHHENKNTHAAGYTHMKVFNAAGGGHTGEVRTPDSNEGFYWGAKHVWGEGLYALGYETPVTNVVKDVIDYGEMIVWQSGDWEMSQMFSSQWWTRLLFFFSDLGIKQIYVDPICNYSALVHADKWIPILPNTDPALDLAVIYTWIKEDLYDKAYIDTHTIGFDKFKAYVMGEEDGIPKTPKWASAICGVPVWTIKALAREWASKKTSVGHFCGTFIRGPYSHEPARLEVIKLAMQGVGGPGIHQLWFGNTEIPDQVILTSMSTQGMGATSMDNPQAIPRSMVARAILEGHIEHWGSGQIVFCPTEDQFKKYIYPISAEEGGTEVHLLWSEKPCNIACWNDGNQFIEAVRSPKIETFITNHQWLENDSIYSDLILPVTCGVEDDDIVGSSWITQLRAVTIQKPPIEPVGESKSDFEIGIEIAKKLGVEEELTQGMSIDEWNRYAYDITGLENYVSWEKLNEAGYYIPPITPNWEDSPAGLREFYENPEENPLDTPSGKIEIYSERLAENFPDDQERPPIPKWVPGGPASEGWTHDESLWGERCKKYPLLFSTGPARWRFHVNFDDVTWFREISTCKIKGTDGYMYEPVWLHPRDAAKRGIQHGDIVKVFNDRGIVLGGAYLTERVIPGAVQMAKGARHDPITTGIDRGGTTNLISPTYAASKNCTGFVVTGYLVEVQKLETAEMDEWKKKYPEAFSRKYDPAAGLCTDGWLEGEK